MTLPGSLAKSVFVSTLVPGALALTGALALLPGCTKRTFGESSSKAITVRGENATSRLYMAYDEAAPMRITWFLCEGEPEFTSSVVRTRARAADAPVIAAGRVARNRPPLPAILESRQTQSPSNALLSGPTVERYIDERMTVAEFRDPVLGKGCKDVLSAEGAASTEDVSNEAATRFAQQKEIEELGPPVFAMLAACSGIIKEGLLIASVLMSADKSNVRSIMGFKGTQVAQGNRGSQLVGLFAGTTFCSLNTRNLFKKLATGQGDVPVTDALFLNYLQRSNDVADALFLKGSESTQASGLPQDVVDAIRHDKETFDALIAENKHAEAAAIFNPYRVGIWNFVLNSEVNTTGEKTNNLPTLGGEFFARLRGRLSAPTPPAPLPAIEPAPRSEPAR